jgi:hypothetical protein
MLESRLRELGGVFEGATNWQPFAIRDGLLITGQNPQSSALVAQHVLSALGMTAKAQALRVMAPPIIAAHDDPTAGGPGQPGR